MLVSSRSLALRFLRRPQARQLAISVPDDSVANVRVHESDVKAGMVGMIGNTPLLRLRALSKETGCNVRRAVAWSDAAPAWPAGAQCFAGHIVVRLASRLTTRISTLPCAAHLRCCSGSADLSKGRVAEPWRLDQGSRGVGPRHSCRAPRHAEAGRHRRRGCVFCCPCDH